MGMRTIPDKPKRGGAIPTRFTDEEIIGIDRTRNALGKMSRSAFIRFATNIIGAQVESGTITIPTPEPVPAK